MDLNHVSAFVRVVQDGTFTAAARALGLPKSSVSRSIAQLEQDLGVRLLHRTTRKIHLTDAGVAFHDRVSRALSEIDEATSAASDLQREMRGPIRVTAPIDLGVAVVAGVVSRFVKRNPGITIEVRLSSRVVDLVAENFDLAVRAGPVRDETLIARRAADMALRLYASPRYLARRGEPVSLEDLKAHDCLVLRTDNGVMRWRLRSTSGDEALIDPQGGISADDIAFLKKAALNGGGIGLFPDFLVARERLAGKLVSVLPDWRIAESVLHVVYPSARYVPQRVVAFRDYLLAELERVATRCSRRAAAAGRA